MLSALIFTLVALTHIGLYVYCRVRRKFAPEYTGIGDRTFSKFDWEMSGVFSLCFGACVPLMWLARAIFFAVSDKLDAIANFFVARIERREEERQRKAEEPVPVSDSYSYRQEAK